ncbi:MAG: methyltransferase [Gemmatimonadaceae bacterium]
MVNERAPTISPADITRILDSVHPAFALVAGMQLDLFTPLRERAMHCEELATILGVDATKLGMLLYNLVLAGLLRLEDERFANSELADRFLVRGDPTYMGGAGAFLADLWQAELSTAASVRSGTAQAEHDFSRMEPGELKAFLAGQHMAAVRVGRTLASRYDFSRYWMAMDVGGGTGGASIGLVGACPNLSATVLELPMVVHITREFVAEAGVSDRVTAVATDIVREPPTGVFDVAVLRNFIQVLSAEEARRAVDNVGKALQPGGSIYIVGSILDDSRLSPTRHVALNLVYLNMYQHGQSYTEGEHRRWLSDAGFVDIRREETTPEGQEMLTARKP